MSEIVQRSKKLFYAFSQQKKLKNSKQRDDILEVFLKIENHIRAEQLHEQVKKKNNKIGFATVCRALKLFCECGLAEEIKIGINKTMYEHKYGHKHHDHLICTKCGQFIEIYSKEIEDLQDMITKANNFIALRHKLEIYGLCSNCR